MPNYQISNGRHLWVGEGGRGFSYDVCLAAGTVCCSEVSLQFLHCSGKFFGFSWPKVKDAVLQVSTLALEFSLRFGLWDLLVSRIISSVLIGLGGLPLVPVSLYV